MTKEELREKLIMIIEMNYPMCDSIADQILTLIREAGWKSPEEVLDACAEAYQEGLDY